MRAVLCAALAAAAPGCARPAPREEPMPRYIIRRIRGAHCKRGPETCELCRKADFDKTCLLDIDPPDRGMVQRRVMDFTIGGRAVTTEFDTVKVFASEDEARAYARAHGITDAEY
jgi:hypothetical protein